MKAVQLHNAGRAASCGLTGVCSGYADPLSPGQTSTTVGYQDYDYDSSSEASAPAGASTSAVSATGRQHVTLCCASTTALAAYWQS